MQERNRATNRHHEERIKNKVKNYHNVHTDKSVEKSIGKVAHSRAICSCWMCGNPRKHFGEVTIHEKIWNEIEKSGSYFPDDLEPYNYENTEPHMWREAEKELCESKKSGV